MNDLHMITYFNFYHLGWTETAGNVLQEGDWFFNCLMFLAIQLTSSSYCFVGLIVFLRLQAVKWPMNYQMLHEKISHVGSIVIWCFPVVVNAPLVIMNLPGVYNLNAVRWTTIILLHVTHSIPILVTVIIYGMLLYTLRQPHSDANCASNPLKKSLSRLIQGVVVCLVVLNLPYIAWAQNLAVLWMENRQGESFTTNDGVKIISRMPI